MTAALFVLLIFMMLMLVTISSYHVADERTSNEVQLTSDSFIYQLLVDMESADSVETDDEGETLTIYKGEEIVIYQADRHNRAVTRDGDTVLKYVRNCNFVWADDTSFILQYRVQGGDLVEYTLTCGS